MKHQSSINLSHTGTSLAVQWLGLCASTAGGTGSIPAWEAKILQATRPKKPKKTKSVTYPHAVEFANLSSSEPHVTERAGGGDPARFTGGAADQVSHLSAGPHASGVRGIAALRP